MGSGFRGVAGGQFGLWRCGRPGLRGLIAVRFRPPMDGAALRGHWNRWMATLTRRFMHRLTGGPATPTGILFDTRLSRPFPRPCEGPGKTGEDHTRVGCYEIDFKVSRRSHLFSDFRKASWLREFDTTVKQRILARMRTRLRPGLRTAASRYERSIGGRGWLVANWVKACGINAKKS